MTSDAWDTECRKNQVERKRCNRAKRRREIWKTREKREEEKERQKYENKAKQRRATGKSDRDKRQRQETETRNREKKQRKETNTSPDKDGGWSRHWLPKEGTSAVGRTGGTLRPHPGVWNIPPPAAWKTNRSGTWNIPPPATTN